MIFLFFPPILSHLYFESLGSYTFEFQQHLDQHFGVISSFKSVPAIHLHYDHSYMMAAVLQLDDFAFEIL
jgi:hypothetical protein